MLPAVVPDDDPEQEREAKGSVGGPRSLSAEMRIFVDVFISNNGNAKDAAIAAGVDPDKAAVQACRWLCREAVAAHIKNQVGRFAHSQLPVAIRTLVDICGNEKLLPKDRIKAANSLIELAGMSAPKGGIQVNVGVVNGSEAQSILTEVHERRARRLSDIPSAMSDTFERDLKTIEVAALGSSESIPTIPGGVELQGPGAGTCPVPVPSTATASRSAVSCECPKCRGTDARAEVGDDEEGSAAEFRRAFEGGKNVEEEE